MAGLAGSGGGEGNVQWPMAACSGEQAAAGAGGELGAGSAGKVQWPIAACSGRHTGAGSGADAGTGAAGAGRVQ